MNLSAQIKPESKVECDARAPLVRLENLTLRFGSQEALSQINLTIRQGDRLGVIGPNGAGKSTLLRVLLGLLPPSEGTVTMASPAPRVGYVPQRLGFDSHFPLTVEEFLVINHPGSSLWFGGVPRRRRSAIATVLEQVGAASLRRQLLGTLSGGEMQRVLVAAGLLQQPQLLILDEPSAGIDHQGSEDLLALLLDLHQRSNLALVFVSHDLHLVSGLADKVACLNGSLCALGAPEEILREHILGEDKGKAFHPLLSLMNFQPRRSGT